MANIEYKSEEEPLYRNDFNPFVAPKEEIEEDLKEQEKVFQSHVDELRVLVGQEKMKIIVEGAADSYPFDKKLIYNSNIKSIDKVNRYDFKDEKSFIEVLEVYHDILIVLNNIVNDMMALKYKYFVLFACQA